jgi:hypothetical protein
MRTGSTIGSVFTRFSLAAVMILLAHDALMATDTHAVSHDHTAHVNTADQGCGTTAGARSQQQDPLPDALPTCGLNAFVWAREGGSDQPHDQILPTVDPSRLRAMLQVFLN